MRYIELTKGYRALVDEEDYPRVMEFKWFVTGRPAYAYRHLRYAPGARNYTVQSMHDLILGQREGMTIDHIDLDRFNNTRANLRFATRSQQTQNRARRGDSLLNYKCIMRNGRNFTARIKIDGRRISVGTFPSQEEAALAYNHAALHHYGEFARLNQIKP